MTETLVDHDVAGYALRLGDDALVLGQRLCEWAARSPQLEEDVALLNIALDLLGAARTLLTRAGELEGRGRDEDDLAFLRHEPDFTNCQLVELDGGDFGRTMARPAPGGATPVSRPRAAPPSCAHGRGDRPIP